MRILFNFLHPDDGSFGTVQAVSAQLWQGFDVYLLALTKGEAALQRFRLSVNKRKMRATRFEECHI